MPRYFFDANSLIRASWDYYAHDIAPGFWEAIEAECSASTIRIPQVVFDEMKNPRELAAWLQATDSLHSIAIQPDSDVIERLGEVGAYVQGKFEAHHAARFLAGGDPWLIAHTLAEPDAQIVTLETPGTPELNRKTGLFMGPPKIPFVAREMGAKSSKLFDAMRQLGIRLSRQT